MPQIIIEIPEGAPLSVKWLKQQLEKLQIFRDHHGEPYIVLHSSEELAGDYGPALLGAVDELWSGKSPWYIYQQVLFYEANLCYYNPKLGEGRYIAVSAAFEGAQYCETEWRRGTWAEGIYAIASSLVYRLSGLTSEEALQVERVLASLLDLTHHKSSVISQSPEDDNAEEPL